MTDASTGRCRFCGVELSRHASQCGECARKRARARATRGLDHIYARTHVHEWPDGKKTIELGVQCEGSCGRCAQDGQKPA